MYNGQRFLDLSGPSRGTDTFQKDLGPQEPEDADPAPQAADPQASGWAASRQISGKQNCDDRKGQFEMFAFSLCLEKVLTQTRKS